MLCLRRMKIMGVTADQAMIIVSALTELAKADKAFRSDAAFARALGIRPQKLSDWKTGRYQVPPEFVSFALLLISLGSGTAIKQALEQRSDVLKTLDISE